MFFCILEVVLGVSQHLEEGLDELLVLQRMADGNVSLSIGGWEKGTPASTQKQPLLKLNRHAQR